MTMQTPLLTFLRPTAAALMLVGLLTGATVQAATPEESLRQSFPQLRFSAIRPGPMAGLYEVVVGGQVLYYVPGPEYIIAGSIHTRDGRNLTMERVGELMTAALKGLPLGQGLKIGQGSHQVIEVTDPDCPYCRQAANFLAQRKDLTRHIFFLPMHRESAAKVRYIFCAADPAAAYEEAMTGRLDGATFPVCSDPAAEDRLKFHQAIVGRANVNSTPLFLIDGHFVNGANIPRMAEILGKP